MYLNLRKYTYANRSKGLNKQKNKHGSYSYKDLAQAIKLITFKKIDMFIIEHNLSSKLLPHGNKSGLTIYPISAHEQISNLNQIDGLSDYKPYNTIKWLHKIFNHGSIGFIAYINDQPVGCCWASEKTPSSLFFGVRIPLETAEIFLHTLFVSQFNRGQKIGEALASYRLQFLKDKGYKKDIAIVDKSNVAAQKLYKKLGYKTIGEISGFRLLYWTHLAYNWYFANDVLSVGTLEGNHQDSW